MSPKQALKACEKISSTHGFICTETRHLCLHIDGAKSYAPSFSISIFRNGEILERFVSTTGFRTPVASVKKYLSTRP